MRVLFALETQKGPPPDWRPLKRLIYTVGATVPTGLFAWWVVAYLIFNAAPLLNDRDYLKVSLWVLAISFILVAINTWAFWWAFFTARLDITAPARTFVTKPEDYNGN